MRGFNFGAGPAALPLPILQEAQEALLNWEGMGMSVLEIGHRTPKFMDLMAAAEAKLRSLLGLKKGSEVLFLGGPARQQFAMIPMNFLPKNKKAAYLLSGVWSEMAFAEAQKFGQVYCAGSSKETQFTKTPDFVVDWALAQHQMAYLYYTPNETVNGTRFPAVPEARIPLVADMTSCLLTEPFRADDFGLIFAGAQKNIANAGLTIAILREDMVDLLKDNQGLATMLDYRTAITHHSLYATPPTFNCYLASKMFDWVAEQGGVQALYQVNCQKAQLLYDCLDASSFYTGIVDKASRSLVNVCFKTPSPALDDRFVIEAADQGLLALKGHRLVGGLRASLYNAMPIEGVHQLVDFMRVFERKMG